MKKSTSTSLLLTAAAAAGAVFYLFYTDRGIRWRKRAVKNMADTVDELLENLENSLAEAEAAAREKMEEV
ncbi:MAG: hypothetical protein ABIQ93_14450 [Saprospiraceae bacterium]